MFPIFHDICSFQNTDLLESNDSSSVPSFEQALSGNSRSASIEPSTSNDSQSSTVTQKKKKRNISCVDDNLEKELFERAITAMDQRSDELDIFGQFVASELRQIYDLVQRNAIKRSIVGVLMTNGSLELATNGYTSETVFVEVLDGNDGEK